MRRFILAAALFFLSSAAASAITPGERARIEALIHHVESLEGAVFIRNGSEHSCKEAAAHMRRKWEALGDRVQTADDFIKFAATQSSITGSAYTIRWKDGRVMESGPYLRQYLKKLTSR